MHTALEEPTAQGSVTPEEIAQMKAHPTLWSSFYTAHSKQPKILRLFLRPDLGHDELTKSDPPARGCFVVMRPFWSLPSFWRHGIRWRFGQDCFKGADFGTEFLHRSLIRLVLTAGGIVTRTLVEQAQKADGIDRAKVIGQDSYPLAVEVDGIGVIRYGAHKISNDGELDWIDHGDGQVVGVTDCEAEEFVVSGENSSRLQTFGDCKVERIKAFETKAVQMDAPLLDGGREGLE